MQHNKCKKNLSVINGFDTQSPNVVFLFHQILSNLDLTYINRIFRSVKSRGINGDFLFKTLFLMPYLDLNNIWSLTISGFGLNNKIKKDSLYEFMKNPNIPWRNILYLFIKRINQLVLQNADHSDISSPKCFILDDTILHKRGKTIELIGKVFDHCSHKMHLGYKVLTLGLWDGKCFLPLDFSIHHEKGKNKNRGLKKRELKNQFTKDRSEDCASHDRVKEIGVDKITIGIEMLKRSCKNMKDVGYILADSWFINEPFLNAILSFKNSPHVIGLMKTNRTVQLGQRSYKASSVPNVCRKDIKYCRKFKCYYISKKIVYKGIILKAYWVKMKGQEKWKLLVCTHTSLSFIKAFEYYQIRWSIEVFFKDCKQNLQLNKCQSTDFDAHIAHISLVYMNYAALAFKKRFDEYDSLGVIFDHFKHLVLELNIVQKIWKIFMELFTTFFAPLGAQWDKFIESLLKNHEAVNNLIEKALKPLSPRPS